MPPEAVAARLEDLASLYELALSLREARIVRPVASSRRAEPWQPISPSAARGSPVGSDPEWECSLALSRQMT